MTAPGAFASEERYVHGTAAALDAGDLLVAGRPSNYRPEVVMDHVSFTALRDGAGLAAEPTVVLAGDSGTSRVYEVEPTGRSRTIRT